MSDDKRDYQIKSILSNIYIVLKYMNKIKTNLSTDNFDTTFNNFLKDLNFDKYSNFFDKAKLIYEDFEKEYPKIYSYMWAAIAIKLLNDDTKDNKQKQKDFKNYINWITSDDEIFNEFKKQITDDSNYKFEDQSQELNNQETEINKDKEDSQNKNEKESNEEKIKEDDIENKNSIEDAKNKEEEIKENNKNNKQEINNEDIKQKLMLLANKNRDGYNEFINNSKYDSWYLLGIFSNSKFDDFFINNKYNETLDRFISYIAKDENLLNKLNELTNKIPKENDKISKSNDVNLIDVDNEVNNIKLDNNDDTPKEEKNRSNSNKKETTIDEENGNGKVLSEDQKMKIKDYLVNNEFNYNEFEKILTPNSKKFIESIIEEIRTLNDLIYEYIIDTIGDYNIEQIKDFKNDANIIEQKFGNIQPSDIYYICKKTNDSSMALFGAYLFIANLTNDNINNFNKNNRKNIINSFKAFIKKYMGDDKIQIYEKMSLYIDKMIENIENIRGKIKFISDNEYEFEERKDKKIYNIQTLISKFKKLILYMNDFNKVLNTMESDDFRTIYLPNVLIKYSSKQFQTIMNDIGSNTIDSILNNKEYSQPNTDEIAKVIDPPYNQSDKLYIIKYLNQWVNKFGKMTHDEYQETSYYKEFNKGNKEEAKKILWAESTIPTLESVSYFMSLMPKY